jgi:2-polyprenyl-6-methoxyphenol hydroxylase-like FAD-dependent oxidoreductase
MKILISGASIAGPVLAYWLTHQDIDVTVVERAPELRKTGGHAIDLFRPAMEISERMGVLDAIEAHATGTSLLTVHRPWASRPARIDYVKLVGAMSDRHVEIMRDDLSEIYYDATRADVEYVFGDELTAISDDGAVTFAHGAPRRFDVVVGADGLHSGVRGLVFGDDVPEQFLGSYLSVVSVPKALAREGEMNGYFEPDRVAMIYTADHLDDARGGRQHQSGGVRRLRVGRGACSCRWRSRRSLSVLRAHDEALARLNSRGVRLYDTMPLPDWPMVDAR